MKVLKKQTAEICKKPKQTAASIAPYGFETLRIPIFTIRLKRIGTEFW